MAGNAFWVIIFLTMSAVIWGVAIYNGLVKRKNHIEGAWSGIAVPLKKRHNLVPNLVKTIKAYTEHEAGLLESVKLRAPNVSNSVSEISGAEQAFSQALQGLMAQVEAYPDIKADESFKNLQNQLSEIEGDIEGARRYYNGAVRDYNVLIQSFPSNIIATHYDFNAADFFELDVAATRQVSEINFSK